MKVSKQTRNLIFLIVIAFILTGCATLGQVPGQLIGGIFGIIGKVIGGTFILVGKILDTASKMPIPPGVF